METPRAVERDANANDPSGFRCSRCGSEEVHSAEVRSAFWHGDRLVVVEDIPAIVCGVCREEFYEDATVVGLDLLRGDGFPLEQALAEVRVPVFSLRDRLDRGRTP